MEGEAKGTVEVEVVVMVQEVMALVTVEEVASEGNEQDKEVVAAAVMGVEVAVVKVVGAAVAEAAAMAVVVWVAVAMVDLAVAVMVAMVAAMVGPQAARTNCFGYVP